MIIPRQFLCYPCPNHSYNGSFLCFEHVITIGGHFRRFWGGGSAPQPTTHSATLGRAFSLGEVFSGTIDMQYDLYMLLLHISMHSFTYILRVAAAVSLFVRRARPASTGIVTNMQGPVPIVLTNAFVWCLNQDSMTDFYVLPRFSAADRHHSTTAIIVVHH